MMFCPKCGSMLRPSKEKEKTVFVCSCGYSTKPVGSVEIKEEIKRNDIEMQIASDDDAHLPITDGECIKCKNNKAYFWLIQTRAGDEPETKFLKCTKCKHIWRDYH